MPRASFNIFVLLVAVMLALAPRCTGPEGDTPIAASGDSWLFESDSLMVHQPDAAFFPVPCPFPGEGR